MEEDEGIVAGKRSVRKLVTDDAVSKQIRAGGKQNKRAKFSLVFKLPSAAQKEMKEPEHDPKKPNSDDDGACLWAQDQLNFPLQSLNINLFLILHSLVYPLFKIQTSLKILYQFSYLLTLRDLLGYIYTGPKGPVFKGLDI